MLGSEKERGQKKEFDSLSERVTLKMPKGKRRNNMKFEKNKNTRHATFNEIKGVYHDYY